MKYSILINTVDSTYATPLLSKKGERNRTLFAKLLKLFRKDSKLDSGTAATVPGLDTEHRIETTMPFKSDKGSKYLSKRFSPRIWRRHSALLSLLEDQHY